MNIQPDFEDFLRLLEAHQVDYMIVGGYAVAFHGCPRFTKDLDVWVWLDTDNADRLVGALEDFGFGSLDLSPADFAEEGTVVQLGFPPKRIDLLTSVDGVDFEGAWERRYEVVIGEATIPFIGVDDLIANKRATGRPQDLADVAALEGHS